MKHELTSRERMLRTLNRQEVDHIPCCFMSFTALRKRHGENMAELAKAERAMGLDAMRFIPGAPRYERLDHPDLRGLPVALPSGHPGSRMAGAGNAPGGSRLDCCTRNTPRPAGILTTTVQLSEDWPHGDHIPFIDDYQVPRMVKPLVTGPEDLDALGFDADAATAGGRRSLRAGSPRGPRLCRKSTVCFWPADGVWAWTWPTGCVVCRSSCSWPWNSRDLSRICWK